MNEQLYRWFVKYKMYHLPFWFSYHFMWWTLRIGSPIGVLQSLTLPHAAAKFCFYMLFQMAGVYFNLYVLVPRFLEKSKYFTYVILLFLTILITSASIVTGYYLGSLLSNKTFIELYGINPNNYFSIFEGSALPSTVAAMTLAMSIKLTKNWIQSEQHQQELKREKVDTELKFLRSQMNPHFLFNTINSIFVLINKNPSMASDALAKFSDLLPYQLYECNEQQIPVSQELGYLANFIDLQKLREDHNQIHLNLQLEPLQENNLMIAPFMLIPLIENAFKHVSRKKGQKNWITMKLNFIENQIQMTISNSISASGGQVRNSVSDGGIGLQNVKRRLDLIYASRYDLDILHDENHFEVKLKIFLEQSRIIRKRNTIEIIR